MQKCLIYVSVAIHNEIIIKAHVHRPQMLQHVYIVVLYCVFVCSALVIETNISK